MHSFKSFIPVMSQHQEAEQGHWAIMDAKWPGSLFYSYLLIATALCKLQGHQPVLGTDSLQAREGGSSSCVGKARGS